MPKITVLMLLDGSRERLGETLASIQAQNVTEWECLLLHDAAFAEIAHEWAKEDSRMVPLQAEDGAGRAERLNLGLEHATGDYVALSEAGTVSVPRRLERQAAFLDNHPEVAICGGSVQWESSKGKSVCEAIVQKEELKAFLLFGGKMDSRSVMLRKSALDEKGLRYAPEWQGDYEFWVRAMQGGLVLSNLRGTPLVICRREDVPMEYEERAGYEERQISRRFVESLGIDTATYSATLFSGWDKRPRSFAKKYPINFLRHGYQLLQEIWEANKKAGMFHPKALKKILYLRWEWVRQSCGLSFADKRYGMFDGIRTTPRITAILPVSHCASTICRTLDTMQSQTFTDWELLVINDAGSEDGTRELAEMYAWNDPRVRVIQAEESLGRAGSLNLGIREAKGEFMAFLGMDTVSSSKRLEKQAAFLDAHPDIDVCGAWEKWIGKNGESCHRPAPKAAQQKARLVFYCDLCPSTLVVRRSAWEKQGLSFDREALDMDFELWSRAALFMQIANLPEALVQKRGDSPELSEEQRQALAEESGRLAARNLQNILGLELIQGERHLLREWLCPTEGLEPWKKKLELDRLRRLLLRIWACNESAGIFEQKALTEVLAGKWCWAKDGAAWRQMDFLRVEQNLEKVLQEDYAPPLSVHYQVFRKEEGEKKAPPKVTALMPLFNGKKYIRESIESIQAQTFTDWEFVIVNDLGSDDGCREIVKEYVEKDPRIVLVQVQERKLGLADSLNLGLNLIKSEYVARVDVDDPSEPDRFEEQVKYLETHPEICLCSCFCFSVTRDRSRLEEVPCDPEELKAAMLFPNEIRHFGVMLRRDFFEEHKLRYHAECLVEDYDLWTRALLEGAAFANIPRVLVSHRWGFGNISIKKGALLEIEAREYSARMLHHLGVNFEKYVPELRHGWRAHARDFAKKNRARFLREGYGFLREIWNKSQNGTYCKPEAMKKILLSRWDWIRTSCGLKFERNQYGKFSQIHTTPMVTVVLPAFQSVADISRFIDSIQAQTFTDWEMLVINDFGSSDGTAEIVKMYTWNDPRIRLVQAETRLGLAESLNLGMRMARGKYIARLDADDTSMPERFEKQVAFLESHPEIGVCGAWQHHYGKGIDWVHQAAPEPEVQKARLIFWCDLCHSLLMLRRQVFMDHQLFYDPEAYAEDYELWTRAIEYTGFANVPEVLGNCQEGTGITGEEMADLSEESGRIIARTLKRVLGLQLSLYEYRLLNDWKNPISVAHKEEDLAIVREVMRRIWDRNGEVGFFNPVYLSQVLAAKYYWLKDNKDWKETDYSHVHSFEDIFVEDSRIDLSAEKDTTTGGNQLLEDRSLSNVIDKMVEQWTWGRYQRIDRELLPKIDKMVEQWTWERYQRINRELLPKIGKMVERWTWERYQRLQVDRFVKKNPWVPYYSDMKIRVVFIFQIASFWPAQESLYKAMLADARFDVKLVCYDEYIDNTIKTETARAFLENRAYDFIDWKQFSIEDYNPHIVFLQTQYDSNRRAEFRRQNLIQKGHRVIFISYGLEIGNTIHARNDQFKKPVLASWRIYTLSETMRRDYLYYAKNPDIAKALGMPRFDDLYHKEQFPPHEEIVECAMGRKIVLWKAHFPKMIPQQNEKILVTPDIKEYIKFAHMLSTDYADMFFVFMPHPRFYEFNEDEKVKDNIRELMGILLAADNVYIDEADDYRPSLLNADAIIVDRSAVMIEAAVVNVPVLYMSNANFYEPMTDAISPLVDSYEQGTTCQDMEEFMERFRQGIDKNKEARNKAFKECIPYFDGKCSERIKEDIVKSLEQESEM